MNDNNNEGRFPFQKMDIYAVAKHFAVLVHRAGIRDSELRDQATRASKSCFLNLCEGLPSDSVAMRRKFFTVAAGSAAEAAAAIDLAEAIGSVDSAAAIEIHALAVRIKMMLRALS